MPQSIGAFVNRDGGQEDFKLVFVFMIARFVRKYREWHEVMIAGSEWGVATA